MSRWVGVLVCVLLGGCAAPSARLGFPKAPVAVDTGRRSYDVDGDGAVDFALEADEGGRFDVISYDDDEDGVFDRSYRLSEYGDDEVPHLVVLLDSVPFEKARERWARDGWGFFEEPTKVIAPFPTMSGVVFSAIMGSAPMEGANNRYYDSRIGRRRDRIWARVWGYTNPWQRGLAYRASYVENGLAFLKPRPWYGAELARVTEALDKSGSRETIVYVASSSGMISKYGEAGLEEVLDGVERLCLEMLHERDGAIKISVVSDHGHNLMVPQRIDLGPALEGAGFRVAARVRDDEDVVIDLDGLVNYVGLHTRRAEEVSRAMMGVEGVDVAMFVEGERVRVLTRDGSGYVERRDGRVRLVATEGDPFGYEAIAKEMMRAGEMDADGFATEEAWLAATADIEWPDVPARIWEAFHGVVVSTPDVMVVMRDGWCVGDKMFERYIDMQSTHGGLNQVNSAAVLLTMRRGVAPVVRSRDVLGAVRGKGR